MNYVDRSQLSRLGYLAASLTDRLNTLLPPPAAPFQFRLPRARYHRTAAVLKQKDYQLLGCEEWNHVLTHHGSVPHLGPSNLKKVDAILLHHVAEVERYLLSRPDAFVAWSAARGAHTVDSAGSLHGLHVCLQTVLLKLA